MAVTLDMKLIRERLARSEAERIRLEEMGRWAAVAAVLRQGQGEIEILLIRRAEREGDPWSGQMALPGGQADRSDDSLLATVEREAREEVALDLRDGCRLIGRLDDLHATAWGKHTGLGVASFVFELIAEPRLVPGPEVAEALWAPLGEMSSGAIDTVKHYSVEGVQLELPAFDIGGRIVWGLTFRILQDLMARTGPR